jgi:hypothetical protein
MAAPVGFDTLTATAAVTTPFAAGATLLSLAVPARTVVAWLDLTATDLDSNAAPAITLNVGDVADVDRYVAASTIARAGGTVEVRSADTAWWRYGLADAVRVQVGTDAATDAAGSVTLTAYVYPGADVTYIVRLTLQAMGVLAEGETPRFDDAAIVNEALAEVHEMLRGKGIANRQDLAWPLALVPMFAARPYAALAANMLADTFGLSAQRAQRMAARAVEGEREIRRQTRKGYSGEPVNLEPYQSGLTTDYGLVLP